MDGLEVASGEITSLNYDKDGKKVKFIISNPKLTDRLSDEFVGQVNLAFAWQK
jgi:hypothetical protein